ncbi:MAG: phage holin family protein [Solirubrobacteraceae bacterium MAG38_C4-C5]|nr:phage holin family protein [Candidatus Siliceabacter maunaloa]
MAIEPAQPPRDPERDPGMGEAVQDVADKVTLLVREEIELAKAEVTEKVTSLVKGIVIGLAAAVFAFFGLFVLLEGFAWFAFWVIPVPRSQIFWGFFLVAGLLFLLGGLAGYLAARAVKAGSPPKPDMAIEEARRIRETVRGD